MHTRRDSGASGFSTLEVVVAMTLALALVAAAFVGFNLYTSAARSHPAAIDIIQRARAAVAVVESDLAMAGAGVDEGMGAGSLSCCLPAILPRRLGLQNADSPTTARPDAVTAVFVPIDAVSSRLEAPLTGPVPTLAASAPCASGQPACGMPDQSTVLVFDRTEFHDYFRLSVQPGVPATLTPRQAGTPSAFPVGAIVTPVETHTYYFDAGRKQLRHYDGFRSDVPVVDNVIAFSVSYLGVDVPPGYPRPAMGGTNCLYDSAGQIWPSVAASAGGRLGVIDLPLSVFRDGPWCGAGENRFDVDLLRVRRVRVLLRLQAADALRASGTLFTLPGTSRSAHRMVPDMEIAVDVAPRNINAGR